VRGTSEPDRCFDSSPKAKTSKTRPEKTTRGMTREKGQAMIGGRTETEMLGEAGKGDTVWATIKKLMAH